MPSLLHAAWNTIRGGGVNYTAPDTAGPAVPGPRWAAWLDGCNVNEMNLTFSAYTRVMRITPASSIEYTSQFC
jgi:hypothetical protein